MQTDFKIERGIYLVKDELTLDLHNDFHFEKVEYSIAERRVTLKWKCSVCERIGPSVPSFICFDFLEVSEFRFYPRNSQITFTEDDCLTTAGYWTDEEWCEGVFFTEKDEIPDPNYLTAFEFMSGAIIVLQAVRAIVSFND